MTYTSLGIGNLSYGPKAVLVVNRLNGELFKLDPEWRHRGRCSTRAAATDIRRYSLSATFNSELHQLGDYLTSNQHPPENSLFRRLRLLQVSVNKTTDYSPTKYNIICWTSCKLLRLGAWMKSSEVLPAEEQRSRQNLLSDNRLRQQLNGSTRKCKTQKCHSRATRARHPHPDTIRVNHRRPVGKSHRNTTNSA